MLVQDTVVVVAILMIQPCTTTASNAYYTTPTAAMLNTLFNTVEAPFKKIVEL